MSYIDLYMTQYTKIVDDDGKLQTVSKDIPYEKCGKNFKFYNQTIIEKVGINDYYCPK